LFVLLLLLLLLLLQTYEILKGFSQSQGIEVGPGLGLVFGMCAGVSSTSCAFPFESVRRKLQVQGVGGRPVLYKGIFSGLAGCIKTNGVMSVYEGCFANCIKMAPAQAITFSCIEIFKPLMLTLAGYD
jgi:solute carrier family 25 phosphate transporter 23/24/25/41